jgi:hypothetical protein
MRFYASVRLLLYAERCQLFITEEAHRVKDVRLWVVFGVQIDRPAVSQDGGAGRDVEAFVRIVLRRSVWRTSENRDWSPSEDFFAERADVRQIWFVGKDWHSLRAYDGI